MIIIRLPKFSDHQIPLSDIPNDYCVWPAMIADFHILKITQILKYLARSLPVFLPTEIDL